MEKNNVLIVDNDGLLTICASCKSICDYKGDWNRSEMYISEHSKAVLSHGICPGCAKELYPEYYNDEVDYLKAEKI